MVQDTRLVVPIRLLCMYRTIDSSVKQDQSIEQQAYV
jgi:hypothetical protein